MRIILRPTSITQVDVWQGHVLVASIYATPGGITIQAPNLEPQDVDIDGRTVHVELRAERLV